MKEDEKVETRLDETESAEMRRGGGEGRQEEVEEEGGGEF